MQPLAITKKVSLSDIGEGWDDCYAIVRQATREDSADALSPKTRKLNKEDAEAFELNFIKEHFMSGKVLVFMPDKTMQLADMQPEHIDTSWKLANKLYYEVLGLTYSPKVSQKEAPNTNER